MSDEIKPCLCAFDECEINKRAPRWAHGRISALEAENTEQARLLGISGSKEAALLAENVRLREALENIADCDCELEILDEHICDSNQEIARRALSRGGENG